MRREAVELWIYHIILLPYLLWNALLQQAFISLPLRANPDLALGGLPLASKLDRHGSNTRFIPTKRLDDPEHTTITEAHETVVTKPVYSGHSRAVTVHDTTDIDHNANEPFLIQPYVHGREFAINLAYHDSLDIYAVTEIRNKTRIWNGDATYVTHDIDTEPFRDACRTIADEIGLSFGRFDVRADSLQALERGEFSIMEVNGAFHVDLTIYAETTVQNKLRRLYHHWRRFFTITATSDIATDHPVRLLTAAVAFTINPLWGIRLWYEPQDR